MTGSTPSSETPTTANDADELTVAITETIAAKRGADPLDVPPLNDYIDVDALASLFPSGAGERQSYGYVRFETAHHEVQVYHDGTFDVRPVERPSPVAEHPERR